MKTLKRSTKRVILICIDTVVILSTMLLSWLFVVFFASIPRSVFVFSVLIVLVSYFIIASHLKIFSIINRYTDYRVLFNLLVSATVGHLVLAGASLFLQPYSYRFLFLSWFFTFPTLMLPRLVWRILVEEREKYSFFSHRTKKIRTLVVGAGSGGRLFIDTVLSNSSDIEIVGIVDGDLNKHGTYIHGIKVMGDRHLIPHIVQNLNVKQVTIAIPSLGADEREKIVEICNSLNVTVNTMPSIEDVIVGRVKTENLKEIDIVDLLGRKEVVLDQGRLSKSLSGKTVLVTGAGGSIGSEISRQIAQLQPKCLLLLGHGENSIYLIHRELIAQNIQELEIIPLIADIQDKEVLVEVMEKYRPHIVYHAAAHKHVPLMEHNPKEAVKNNIFGTKNIAEASLEAGVEKFVMVSTDKAVNPPNVMGATKRIAEMIVTGLNGQAATQFVAVRFGNVLGSRGSVVPVFKEQVAKGGPLTVTDFRMTRYFMTIPEASRLVIQAGCLAQGGEIFVLDMGEPVKIVDLAKKVIKLSGHSVSEIGIVETGIRPGEKLYEELLSSSERVGKQIHEKIFVGKVTPKPLDEVESFIAHLLDEDPQILKQKLIAFARQE